jgi:hypothetical protein
LIFILNPGRSRLRTKGFGRVQPGPESDSTQRFPAVCRVSPACRELNNREPVMLIELSRSRPRPHSGTATADSRILNTRYTSLSPGCRAVELSRLRRAAVEYTSKQKTRAIDTTPPPWPPHRLRCNHGCNAVNAGVFFMFFQPCFQHNSTPVPGDSLMTRIGRAGTRTHVQVLA